MKSYRQRMQVQRRQQVTVQAEQGCQDPNEIEQLERKLHMYRGILDSFEPLSDEWMLCKNDMTQIAWELAELGVEVIKIDG